MFQFDAFWRTRPCTRSAILASQHRAPLRPPRYDPHVRVAVIQMNSSDNVDANLKEARGWIDDSAAAGAELIALPENFAYMRHEGDPIACPQDFEGPIVGTLRDAASRHGIWLLGGSFPEVIDGDPRVHNTSVAISPAGEVAAVYRKIHLFDVDLRDRGGKRYAESETFAPGAELAMVDSPFGGIGLSICYDLRFPELYRLLAARGARWLAVPSAFARETGKDHWEVLLRARAIENQCFVLAAAQSGEHGGGRASYGRSMIIDPWGLVLAQAPDRPGPLIADCDLVAQGRLRETLPALGHRREELMRG